MNVNTVQQSVGCLWKQELHSSSQTGMNNERPTSDLYLISTKHAYYVNVTFPVQVQTETFAACCPPSLSFPALLVALHSQLSKKAKQCLKNPIKKVKDSIKWAEMIWPNQKKQKQVSITESSGKRDVCRCCEKSKRVSMNTFFMYTDISSK